MKKINTLITSYLTKQIDDKGVLEAIVPNEFEITKTTDKGVYTLIDEVIEDDEQRLKITKYYKIEKSPYIPNFLIIEKGIQKIYSKYEYIKVSKVMCTNIEWIKNEEGEAIKYKRVFDEEGYKKSCILGHKEYFYGFEVKRHRPEYERDSKLNDYEKELFRNNLEGAEAK